MLAFNLRNIPSFLFSFIPFIAFFYHKRFILADLLSYTFQHVLILCKCHPFTVNITHISQISFFYFLVFCFFLVTFNETSGNKPTRKLEPAKALCEKTQSSHLFERSPSAQWRSQRTGLCRMVKPYSVFTAAMRDVIQ